MRPARLRRASGVGVTVIDFLRGHRPVAVGLVVALALVVSFGGVSGASPSPTFLRPLGVEGNGPCAGPGAPANLTGGLRVDGGPLNSSAGANVSVAYAFHEQVEVRYAGNQTLVSENCTRATGAVATNASGGFAIGIVAPGTTCRETSTGEECTSYAAPFEPLSVTTAEVPSGYGLSAAENGSSVALTWVADLASLEVNPPPPLAALASGAVGTFVAHPEMANGSASPEVPTFSWSLRGPDYRFVTSPRNGSAAVVAGPGWANGTLSVRASLTVGSNSFDAPPVTIALATVPTTLSGASVNRTVVDAGGTAALSVSATGAAGYTYALSVAPGIAEGSAGTVCPSTIVSASAVAVRCTDVLTFPAVGSGRLTVNVSNGDSSVTWQSPNVTVAPPPTLRLSPSTPVGYTGVPLPVDLVAASGVPPYGEACFAPGYGNASCRTGPGPLWAFAPTYPSAGTYAARAWLVDAAGTNTSLAVPVAVVDPPEVGPLSAGSLPLAAGVPVVLSSSFAGGALPARAFWNASDAAGPIATTWVTADGPLSLDFRPPAAGTVRLSLTVVDALGTAEESRLVVAVGPGPVAVVTPVPASPTSPTVVGEPLALAWHALDALGEAIPTFAAPVDLEVLGAAGVSSPSWVNLSSLGPLSAAPEGSFAIPASAWVDGVLAMNFTPSEAGALSVVLEGSALPGGAVGVTVPANPDLDHLRLSDPVVSVAGAQTNHTFWRVTDRFGDPVPGAILTVQYAAAGTESDTALPVGWTGTGETGVWVNYSLPAGSGGTVRLLDAAGDLLYGPVTLSGPSPSAGPGPLLAGVSAAVALAALGVGGTFAYARRRRARRSTPRSEEEELRRLAEGRAEAVEIVRALGPADLATLRAAWSGDPPSVDELGEWLASLVADGSLARAPGPDGRPEYALAAPPPAGPRVVVDAEALERAVARREAAVRDDRPDGPPP